jgi:hypothetical protein
MRAAHHERENEIDPNWQRTQYTRSMFSTHLQPIGNARYPNIRWTGIVELIGSRRYGCGIKSVCPLSLSQKNLNFE